MKNLRHLLRRVASQQSRKGAAPTVRPAADRRPTSRRRLISELLESRQVMAADGLDAIPIESTPVMHNEWIPQDVNDDKSITALDALMVINHINQSNQVAQGEAIDDPSQFSYFVDVNGDNVVTALDALQVINEINRRSGEDATDQVEFFLAARSLDDQLLTNTAGATDVTPQSTFSTPLTYSVPVNTPFKLEVSVQDLRDTPNGIFQVATNLLLSQADVIEPLVGEIQEISVDSNLVATGANARTGTMTFSRLGHAGTAVIRIEDFRAASTAPAREALIAQQIVALYPEIDSVNDVDVDFIIGTTNRLIRVRFSDQALANMDLPRLLIDFNVETGAPLTLATYVELNPKNVDGTFNSVTLARNFESINRQNPSLPLYGTTRTFGAFSNSTVLAGSPAGFTTIGTIGPTAFLPGFFAGAQLDYEPSINYDAFSILVQAKQPTPAGNPLKASLSNDPTTTEQVLVYGATGQGTSRDAVVKDDIALDSGTSSFFLNVTGGQQTGITANPGTLTVAEDANTNNTINLANLVTRTTVGETVTYSVTTNPTNGMASVSTAGVVTYTPNPNYFGSDSFVYQASNVTDGAASNTVSITVTPVNDAPVAGNDSATATAGQAVTINVLANDNAGPGPTPGSFEQGTLTIAAVATPANGVASIVNGQISYTPNANFAGPTETFTYTINDGSGANNATATGTITVTVNPVSTGITARNSTVTIDEDAPEAVIVADLNSLITVNSGTGAVTFTVVSQSAGVARVNGNQLLYTPAANANGNAAATINYRATNSLGIAGAGNGVITVNITAVNDNPTAVNDGDNGSLTVNEGSSATFSVLANDSDVDGAAQTAALTITETSTPNIGTVERVNNNTQLRFTAPANSGPAVASFTYTISDGQGGTATASVSVNIVNVVGAPVAADASRTIAEDSAVTTIDLTTLVTGEPNETFTFTRVGTAPTLGNATVTGSTLSFTPNANANGTATVTYRATSTTDSSRFDEGTITFNITAVNDAPVAADLTRSVAEGGTLIVQAADLGTDVDSTTLTPVIISQPANGVADLVGNTLRYRPAAGFNGTNTITFQLSDGTATSATRTLTVNVTDVVVAPVGNDGTLSLAEDSGLRTLDLRTISVIDPNDNVTYTIVTGPAATAGTASVTSAGVLSFTPAANFFGSASVVYRVTGTTGNDTGIVNITVTAVNDAPVAENDTASTLKNTTVTINVLSNDNLGPSNETQTGGVLSIVSNGNLGTASVVNGQIRYVPNLDAIGTDTVTYRLTDGSESDTATITITIQDFLPSQIQGRLFVDGVNNFLEVVQSGATPVRDGVYTPGERVLGAAQVRLVSLSSQNASGVAINLSTITNLEGEYAFENVPPGQYEIVYDLPTGAVAMGEASDGRVPVTIGPAGNVSPTANFTLLGLGSAGSFNSDIITSNNRNRAGEPVSGGATAMLDSSGFQLLFQAARGFDGVQLAELSLNNNRDAALLTIIRDDGTVETAQIGSSSLDATRSADGTTVVKLIGGVDDFEFEETIDALVRSQYPSYRKAIDIALASGF